MPLLNTRWMTFFAASTAVLITLVGVVGWASFQEGIKNKDKQNSFGVDFNSNNDTNADSMWPATENALAIFMHVDSFDPSKFGTALGFRLDYQPINNLSDPAQEFIVPVVPVRLVLQTVVTNFAAATLMPLQTVSQIMVCGPNEPLSAQSLPIFVFYFDVLPLERKEGDTVLSRASLQQIQSHTLWSFFLIIIVQHWSPVLLTT
ncbi:hypothetical protein C8J57DRAFT_1522868 [Mycena rebaudengoi]|nr:hypothetical protein C8J57DRAFT_1522868 [Mycena rebaudengoi]